MKDKIIVGLTEPAEVIGNNGEKIQVTVRIDSGATFSSIDADLAKKLEYGPVIKHKIVKSASGVKRRPVVKAQIKIEGKIFDTEMTTADRSHMTYPVLIGQNILKKGFLIDPNKVTK